MAASLGGLGEGRPQGRLLVADADSPVALAALPGGGLRYGERLTGRVRKVDGRRPLSARLGNGGHLELSPDGRLLVGIANLQRDDRNGRLLALNPDGSPEQDPEVVSGGWNNPFAFGSSPSDRLWVADNAPGREGERLVGLRPGAEWSSPPSSLVPRSLPPASSPARTPSW